MERGFGRRSVLAGGGALLLGARTAAAQGGFPSRPVRLLLGAGPGSAPDVAARLMSERLSALWRQPVVVDNRAGANGNLAAQATAGAEGDGHTLLFAQASILVLNEALMRSPGFNSERDFVPVSLLMTTPFVIAARPDFPAATLPELLAMARARPGALTFATSSSTNLPRFAGELLKKLARVDLLNVPYNAMGTAIQDTLTGRVDLMIEGTPVLTPQVKGGQMKALAITSAERFNPLAETPTVAETLPGFASVGWFGIVAPRSTPAPLAGRIAEDIRGVLAEPALRERLLRDFGAETVAGTPDAFAAFVAQERATYRGLIRDLGVTID